MLPAEGWKKCIYQKKKKKRVTKNIPRAGIFSGTPMEDQIFGYHNTIQSYSAEGHAGG